MILLWQPWTVRLLLLPLSCRFAAWWIGLHSNHHERCVDRTVLPVIIGHDDLIGCADHNCSDSSRSKWTPLFCNRVDHCGWRGTLREHRMSHCSWPSDAECQSYTWTFCAVWCVLHLSSQEMYWASPLLFHVPETVIVNPETLEARETEFLGQIASL